jgi:hypothetical protein
MGNDESQKLIAELIERILALTVTIAIIGGCLIVAVLFVLLRITALEQHITDTQRDASRKIKNKLDELEFPPR